MDKVTAGFDLKETDIGNTSWTSGEHLSRRSHDLPSLLSNHPQTLPLVSSSAFRADPALSVVGVRSAANMISKDL